MSGFLGQLLGSLGGGGGQASGLSSVVGELLGGGARPATQPDGTPVTAAQPGYGQPGYGQAGAGQAGVGGLTGLMAMLDQAGLGDKVRSWVGTGANQPISPDQLGAALPADKVEGWAQQSGLPVDKLLAGLAHVLPTAVDHATPGGTVPADGAPPPSFDVAGIIGKMMNRSA